MDSPAPGTVIAERYRLTRPLGSGSSAVVWEAHDSSLDRPVAVKLLHGGAAAHPAGREQLRREALALARLSHPRVTTVFDYVEWPQPDGSFRPVLVTELLTGLNLEERLAQGPLMENDARVACQQLATALEAAHKAGIVHRDLKPGNVMLLADGVKLLDFGIAQASSDTDATTGVVIGTPSCMAPEQLTGRGAVPASDVYALGCVLYWCVAGRAPFEGATVDEVVRGHLHLPPPPLPAYGLPPQILGLYRQCLAKNPADRPTAATVAAVLDLRGAPATVGGVGGAGRPPANRTMVMQAYDPPPPTYKEEQEQQLPYMARRMRIPSQDNEPGGYPAQPVFDTPAPRRYSWVVLVFGALLVAVIAAAGTAIVMGGKDAEKKATSAPPPGITGSPAPNTAATLPATPPSVPDTPASGSRPAAGSSPTGDPNADPLGYLEAMRGQIDGFLAQGRDTIDSNTARDLQNSLTDLEKSTQQAQAAQFKGRKLRDLQSKVDDVTSKISEAQDEGKIGDAAAEALTTELQTFAVSVGHG
ncbi:serine/threonine-protein kinase [Catenulispora subtropica]|uniref:non-specific serine/threonine protein kinase n=1 Tax=Catenulispora subtropica TaxID=450798 RepID=A0ABN2TFM1_9ACTN